MTMPYNALIRTHHITSRKKVSALKQAADRLNCFALLRYGGCPGIMYVEAKEKEAVESWVSVVRNLRYKDFQLVNRPSLLDDSNQDGDQGQGQNKQVSSRRSKGNVVGCDDWRGARTGLSEVETVKEFGNVMEQRGVWEWWRRGMGYVS